MTNPGNLALSFDQAVRFPTIRFLCQTILHGHYMGGKSIFFSVAKSLYKVSADVYVSSNRGRRTAADLQVLKENITATVAE